MNFTVGVTLGPKQLPGAPNQAQGLHSPVASSAVCISSSGDESANDLEDLKPLPPERGAQKRLALLNRSLRKRKRAPEAAASASDAAASSQRGGPPPEPAAQAPQQPAEEYPAISVSAGDATIITKLSKQGKRPAIFKLMAGPKQVFQVTTTQLGLKKAYAVAQQLCKELASGTLTVQNLHARREELANAM